MRSVRALLIGMVVFLCASPGLADEVVVGWRSPFGFTRSLAVDPTDSSVWVACGGSMMHLAEDGSILSQADDYWTPWSVSVNPTDSSCWVAERSARRVSHLAADGSLLWRGGNYESPYAVSVDPTDDSCWVAVTFERLVVHLAENGTEVARIEGFEEPRSVSVCPADGSFWVADNGGNVARLDAEGTELWRGYVAGIRTVVADPEDGSCWAGRSSGDSGNVRHLAGDGTLLWSSSPVSANSLAVNPADGSCWAGDSWRDEIRHFANDGTALERWQGFLGPSAIAANPTDGSLWVGEDGFVWDEPHMNWTLREAGLQHFSASGSELWSSNGFSFPWGVSVNVSDGSCWVADTGNGEVAHLARDRSVLWRGAPLGRPEVVAANSTDGSCWVADTTAGVVVLLSADHIELARVSGFTAPVALSVDRADGSCWVADRDAGEVVHLSASGVELWRGSFELPKSVSVDPRDRSCWVADYRASAIAHLANDGSELGVIDSTNPSGVAISPFDGTVWELRLGGTVSHYTVDGTLLSSKSFYQPEAIAVDETDGYCWVVTSGENVVVLLDNEGTEVWRGGGVFIPRSIAVDSADGSAWIADTRNCQVAHFLRVGPFEDIAYDSWASKAIEACVSADMVSGYDDGLYHGDWPVTRDQIAVYISRGLAGGDAYVPTGPAEATFADVDAGNWAYDYIEYAAAEGVVQGYLYTMPDNPEETLYLYEPSWTVTRDQMAVYVARALVAPTGEAALADYVPTSPRNFPEVQSTGYGDDETEPFWAYRHIEYCVEHGVVEGYDDGYYHPEIVVTRDQMAVYVARTFGLAN